MRKAGLALQSPFRCVSGCFSSHSEFKSHLIPAPALPPASAALQSGAVCVGPGGAGGRGRVPTAPASPGDTGTLCPPATPPALGSVPSMCLWLLWKACRDRAVCGGLFLPRWGAQPCSGIAVEPGTSVLLEFYIPFKYSHFPKFPLLPCSSLWGRAQPGDGW